MRSIMIVDDHAHFRSVARRMLESEGWTVVAEADDGRSALRQAARHQPDVVLLDVGLPDISGIDVARRLRTQAPEIAVVMVSTHDPSDYRELVQAAGARGFVAKSDLCGPALAALLAP